MAPADCDSMSVAGNLPAEIREASGIAIGRRTPGILWVHNDDAPAVIFALDQKAKLTGRVRISGVENRDWEDIAIAPCAGGSCLFIADIGDNNQSRTQRVVYQIPEPLPRDASVRPFARYPFHLPGKSHDAEALFILPDGRMFVITKGRSGPITIYEFPQPLRPDVDVELRPVTTLSSGLVQLPDMVTGAGVTPDGRFVAIRTYSALQLYRVNGDDFEPVYSMPVSLEPLKEPQGEGIDIDDAGIVYLVSEKGLEKRAPLSRLVCKLPG